MYKLLLVSDRDEVLSAFDQVKNWEIQGFKPPHIRHDFEGARESLSKHHADGIAIALSPEEDTRLMDFLRKQYPNVSVFEAGTTPDAVIRYLNELKTLLNRVRADFSNDDFSEMDLMTRCRRDYFRKLIHGHVETKADLYRNMRLMCSRMDPDRPCMVFRLEQSAPEDRLEGRWHDGPERLELALRNSFGSDHQGMHILPIVHTDGRITVLAVPVRGAESATGESMTAIMTAHTADSIAHLQQFMGLELRISGIRVLPALTALCGDTTI